MQRGDAVVVKNRTGTDVHFGSDRNERHCI